MAIKKNLLAIVGALVIAMVLLPIEPNAEWEPCRLFIHSGTYLTSGVQIESLIAWNVFIPETIFLCLVAILMVNMSRPWRRVLLGMIAVLSLAGISYALIHTVPLVVERRHSEEAERRQREAEERQEHERHRDDEKVLNEIEATARATGHTTKYKDLLVYMMDRKLGEINHNPMGRRLLTNRELVDEYEARYGKFGGKYQDSFPNYLDRPRPPSSENHGIILDELGQFTPP